MQIRESAEDYLEAILRLSQKGGGVRSVDIATMLSVSKPSVSHAMKLLREDGYIAMDRYGTVTLLDKGAEIANRIYERHTVLTTMLESLGVPSEIASTKKEQRIPLRTARTTVSSFVYFRSTGRVVSSLVAAAGAIQV